MSIDDLKVKTRSLVDKVYNLKFGADDAAAKAALLGLQLRADRYASRVYTAKADMDTRPAELALLKIEAAADRAVKRYSGTTTAAGKAGGGLFGLIGAQIPLFGGAATIGGIHVLADAIAEITAVAAPAAIALGAFGAAAIPTIQGIYTQEKNLYTVSQALGLQMPGLSGGFAKMAAAVQPQVYSLMGEALNTINQKGGVFQQLATGAGTVLDQLGARAELALGSHGLSGLLQGGVHDLSLIGNIGGNVLGTLGNLLKTMPGYAEALARGLLDVTSGLEHITASSAVQGILHAGLAMHGLFLYSGLAATAVTLLKSPLTSLGSTLTTAALNVGAFGENVVKAEGAAGKLSAVFGFLTKVPVWGWVAVGVAALTGLVVWLASAKDATQKWVDSLQQGIDSQLTIPATMAATAKALQDTNTHLKTATEFTTQWGVASRYTGPQVTATYAALASGSQKFSAEANTQKSELADLTTHFGSLGKAMGIAAALHINLVKAFQEGGAAWKQAITEMKGYTAAVSQLAGYSGGRALAAQNALTFATDQQRAAIQQVTQAQDTLINTVIGGEQAFSNFIIGMKQTGIHAYSASNGFKALAAQTQKTSDFWNVLIPKSQALVDSLNAQEISTGKLRTAVATIAKEDLLYAGNNKVMQASVVAFINNALAPGTVSLKTLHGWVKQNSTSLQGLNSIVGQSTIKAGSLAGVLENKLNVQFHDMLLKASGASGALKTYTQDLIHNRENTAQGHSDRQTLIKDLEKAGLSAKQAAGWVDRLSRQLGKLPAAKGVHVYVRGTGKTYFRVGTTGLVGMATGGKVPGHGHGDTVPAMLTPGELVIPKHMVKAGLVDHLKGMLPGFESGGVVGSYNGPGVGSWMTGQEGKVETMVATFIGQDVTRMIDRAMARAISGAIPAGSGVWRWRGLVDRVLAMEHLPTGLDTRVLAQMQSESGGNPRAINLTDINAQRGDPSRGLMQVIGSTFAAYHWPGTSWDIYNPMANIAAAINYARHVYGPSLMANGMGIGSMKGYDTGGLLMPGLTLAYNGTGRPERVVGPHEPAVVLEVGTAGGNSTFDQFLLTWIRKHVRVRGGGNVQVAFGR